MTTTLSPNAKSVLETINQLSSSERELVLEILNEPDQEISDAWLEECEARLQAYFDGHMETIDGEDVFKKLRAKYS
jgi:hypothetical protein